MATFNPFLPSFLANPYRQYAALRRDDRVHYSTALEAWVLTGYAECLAVLRDADTFSSDPRLASSSFARQLAQQRREFPLGEVPTLLNSDPPTHTRLRGLVNRAFTPRVVEGLRPRIEALAEELLDASGDGPFDVVQGLAQPLPVIVIAELLGVPAADRERFKAWSTPIAQMTNVITTEALRQAAQQAVREFMAYMEPLIAARRREPRDDLLSALALAEEDGARLSHEELQAFCLLVMLAGHETTTNLIGNGTLALVSHPEAAARLRDRPALLSVGVEELLRYDSPVQAVVRVARAQTTLGVHQIEAGSVVLALIGAANRDPEQFEAPEEVAIDREPNRHLSFGLGPHFCLGAPLARLEATIAFGALLRRFPALRLAEPDAPRAGTLALRGVARLVLAR